jgi:hypothetical protein
MTRRLFALILPICSTLSTFRPPTPGYISYGYPHLLAGESVFDAQPCLLWIRTTTCPY